MNNPALPQAKTAGSRSGVSAPTDKEREKFFPPKARKPLKSLDSDERIQGNPRQSNTYQQGSSQRNGQGQENPKRIDRTRPAAEKEPNRLHPKAKRLRLQGDEVTIAGISVAVFEGGR